MNSESEEAPTYLPGLESVMKKFEECSFGQPSAPKRKPRFCPDLPSLNPISRRLTCRDLSQAALYRDPVKKPRSLSPLLLPRSRATGKEKQFVC